MRVHVNLGFLCRSVVCGAVLAGMAAPQRRVLHVAPSGTPYQQITQAIAASAPGDTILVASGTYQPFSLSFGLTIEAEVGAAPVVEGYTVVQGINPGQTVVLAGLLFRSRPWTQLAGDIYALSLVSLGGVIAMVGSRAETGPLIWRGPGLPRPTAACNAVPGSGGVVVLERVDCIGRSGTRGLNVGWVGGGQGDGVVVVQGGSAVGGDSDCFLCSDGSTPAGAGIFIGGGSASSRQIVYLSDVQAQGGNVLTGSGEAVAGTGLYLHGYPQTFVRAGTHTIRGGTSGNQSYQRSGDGLVLDNSPGLFVDGAPFIAGATMGMGVPGLPVRVVSGNGQLVPRLLAQLSFDTTVFDRLIPTTLTVAARPGELHFLALAFDAGWLQLPGIPEPIHVFSTPNWLQYGYLFMNSQGFAQTQVVAPNDPNLIGLPVWFQSFGYDPTQLVVGPLAGSAIR